MAFETFEIHVAERVVSVGGNPISFGARAFDVLMALAERRDRVVSKAELMDVVWPGVVVEENNLNVQIWALRRALGASAIVTVTGRGYRLVAELRKAGGPARAAAAPSERLQRRLTTILQGDVAGWARHVARDPVHAAKTWQRIRLELIERSAPAYGGRPIELTAERIQLEFASAVEAVAWSIELQNHLAERRQAADGNGLLHVRIAIAVDDVIVDDGKLVGDGVNVAADLQQSAGRDEVLITQKVRDFVESKLDAGFEPLGERLLQHTQRPIRVFRVDHRARAAVGAGLQPGALARVASIAVLPFASDSTATEAYFGGGITEEIIASLSLNHAFFVIAHSSTPRYRGVGVDLAAAAAELGVRYLVTGSVQREGARLRIRANLLAASDLRVLWHERFDGSPDDLFSFQVEIAIQVAAALAPHVQDEEVARMRKRPTASYDAYDCVLRGLGGIYQLGTAEFDQAGVMFQRAVDLDPLYAQAHAHLAWWHSLRQFEGRSPDDGSEGPLALKHGLQAMRLDSRDAWVLSVAGYMLTLQKQHAQAMELFEQALALNPSCAAAWARSGATLSYLGQADGCLRRVQRAIQLSPFDQHMFWYRTILGGGCFVGRRYAEAAGWLGKALRLNPRFNGARRVRIASLARSGELGEAQELAQEMLQECPEFSVAEFGRLSPMQPPGLDDLLLGLRQAGLPD